MIVLLVLVMMRIVIVMMMFMDDLHLHDDEDGVVGDDVDNGVGDGHEADGDIGISNTTTTSAPHHQ